jgi:hypothetical protein
MRYRQIDFDRGKARSASGGTGPRAGVIPHRNIPVRLSVPNIHLRRPASLLVKLWAFDLGVSDAPCFHVGNL